MRKPLILLTGTLLLFICQSVSAQWITINEPYVKDNISKVYWKDGSTVFVSGQNNMVCKSTDAGDSWSYSNSGINQITNSTNIRFIKFFNSTTGFVCSSFIYKTTNGGNNWNVVSSHYFDEYILVDENVIYGINSTPTAATLHKSINGGLDFAQADTAVPPLPTTRKIVFVNGTTGYRATEHELYKTTNSGANWFISCNFPFEFYRDVTFQDSDRGLILVAGGLRRTTDGGSTWSGILPAPFDSKNFIFYKNDSLMYASASEFIFSTNSGTTFETKMVLPLPFPAADLNSTVYSFVTKNTGIISRGTKIFKTTDFASTFIDVSSQRGMNTNMNGIHMFDANEIFISSDSCIWKTTNAGNNWNKMHSGSAFSQIDFADYNTGFVINEVIKKTTNHGNTWVNLPLPPFEYPRTFTMIRVINDSSIIVKVNDVHNVSSTTVMRDMAFYTSNNGSNWNKILEIGSNQMPLSYQINLYDDIFFVNSSTGFALLNYRYATSTVKKCQILRTTNKGANWSIIVNRDSCLGGNLHFLNENTGYFSMQSNPSITLGNGIFKTTDGGTSWNFLSEFYAKPFIFTNEYTAFANGYASSNGGAIWISQFTPSSPTAIQFINNYTGFIVGNTGVIYKTTNAGGLMVNVTQTSSIIPDKHSLSQNYPNPFNPSTKINYEIKSSGLVSLKVFDLLGKQVASLVSEKQNAGSYAVDFNSSEFSLPSGIYFYTLNAGEFTETRKMILVK